MTYKIKNSCFTAVEYLGSSEKVAELMNTAKQLSDIQKDCIRILPHYFSSCSILKLADGILLIGVSNQSIAARVRQNIPVLQSKLNQSGWMVNTIRLKVQLPDKLFTETPAQKKTLSPKAFESIVNLYEKLDKTKNNTGLSSALNELINCYQRQSTNHIK